MLLWSNVRYEASAPTGCANNIINGTIHNSLFKIPLAAIFNKEPSYFNTTNVTSIKDMCDKWKNLFLIIMYEDSMAV